MGGKINALDLRKDFPASPREISGGFAHLARMRDKARATAAGTVGDYRYFCPLDQALLEFVQISREEFYEAAQKMENEELSRWFREKGSKHSEEEIRKWNQAFLSKRPETPEKKAYFLETRNKINPKRTDVETWADLLDLEEGRLK